MTSCDCKCSICILLIGCAGAQTLVAHSLTGATSCSTCRLISNYKDYSGRLDDYFIESVIENIGEFYDVPDEIQEIIDKLEESEEVEV